jgi:hypothetical protein
LSTIYTVAALLVAREEGRDMLERLERELGLGTNRAIFFASTSFGAVGDAVDAVSPGFLPGVVGMTGAGGSLA